MTAARPPLNRDIKNLINDGSVFRRETPSFQTEGMSGPTHAENTSLDAEQLTSRRSIGALAVAMDGVRQIISRDSKNP